MYDEDKGEVIHMQCDDDLSHMAVAVRLRRCEEAKSRRSPENLSRSWLGIRMHLFHLQKK